MCNPEGFIITITTVSSPPVSARALFLGDYGHGILPEIFGWNVDIVLLDLLCGQLHLPPTWSLAVCS